MSTSGINSSLLSQTVDSPSELNQFVSALNRLASDLQSGNLSAAQQDYVTLSADTLNGASSSTADSSAGGITGSLLSQIASSPESSSSFIGDLNQIGAYLQNGDLTSAQEEMLNLNSTALIATSSANDGSAAAGIPSSFNPEEIAKLVQTVVQAMEDGDNSLVSFAMLRLASTSPSAQGAGALEQESRNFASSSSSSSGSVSQLLQNSDTESAPGSQSILNTVA